MTSPGHAGPKYSTMAYLSPRWCFPVLIVLMQSSNSIPGSRADLLPVNLVFRYAIEFTLPVSFFLYDKCSRLLFALPFIIQLNRNFGLVFAAVCLRVGTSTSDQSPYGRSPTPKRCTSIARSWRRLYRPSSDHLATFRLTSPSIPPLPSPAPTQLPHLPSPAPGVSYWTSRCREANPSPHCEACSHRQRPPRSAGHRPRLRRRVLHRAPARRRLRGARRRRKRER
jgi:hypothetical protein